ncbi:hypothetical protein VTN77DRAFT_2091 [Rasamsonia byssochlamydoides]|uniref:uncharacterized protein n=1 Tax=Rasamsonia byssochlamydoides TaxID=89139 RepID=UPI003743307D
MSAPIDSSRPPTTHGKGKGKRRASQACSTCRARKIRCDMLQTGLPCSRCRIDRFECAAEPRKKRGKRTVSSSNVAGDEARGSLMLRALPKHSILHQVPYSPFLLEFADVQLDREVETHDNDICTEGDRHNIIHDHSGEDILFLRQKGAFDLPQRHIMDEFISTYFRVFHPFFSVVNKEAFLKEYQDYRGMGTGCSLLLLQAVLFVASSYVPPELLAEAGFSSRKKARQVIHRRAKYLYTFDYESNDIITIQALLLLSHHYSSLIDQKHTWHWVYQAISLAQGAGLHRDPGDAPPAQRRLWARIWWACLVRDRLVSLGTGRPMHINSLDCTVRMLTPDDLEESGDGDEDRVVKAIFLEFVKLCQCMEGILSLQQLQPSTMAGKILSDQVRVCENTLQHWLDNLAPEARRQEDSINSTDRASMATLYRTVLHLIYNTVIIALNQCSVPVPVPGTIDPSDARMTRQEKIQLAASDSTQLVAQLVNFDLVKYCPTICVTAVLPPLIIHLLGIRGSSSPSLKQLHTNRYNMCMMFLEQLGDIYWHASIYHDFFELALSVRHSPTEAVSSNEDADPLVAFLRQKMMSRGGLNRKSSEGARNENEADCDDGISLRPTQAERISEDYNWVYKTSDSSRLGPEQTAPAPEMDVFTVSDQPDQQDVQLDEWLDFGAGFHSIFPAA